MAAGAEKFPAYSCALASLATFLFPETGDDVDFEVKHVVTSHDDGSLSMSWIRSYQFAGVQRDFHALMRFHPQNGPIINWHGCRGLLQVELARLRGRRCDRCDLAA